MLLHEAVRAARIELNLSQKKLAQKAKIQRRQLATLESGGNVTLATVRKVLAHLPNLESFTLEAVNVDVKKQEPSNFSVEQFAEAMTALSQTLDSLARMIQQGQHPDPKDVAALHEANVRLLADLPPENRAIVLGDRAPEYTAEIEARLAELGKKE